MAHNLSIHRVTRLRLGPVRRRQFEDGDGYFIRKLHVETDDKAHFTIDLFSYEAKGLRTEDDAATEEAAGDAHRLA